jgi:hypothetical protein
MRHAIALGLAIILIYAATGCRHVAGGCDCEHAPGAGAPAYQYVTPPSATPNAAPMPLPKG